MLPVKSSLLPTVTRFFDDDWTSVFDWKNQNNLLRTELLPSVNIKETKEDFLIEMAIPGMQKEDFSIEVKNNVLFVKGERKNENAQEDSNGEKYTRREFSYKSFQRSFNLNTEQLEDTKITAKYENGILNLCIPKKEKAKEKPAHQIQIS